MTADWEKLEIDLSALKVSVAAMRDRAGELNRDEIDRLLVPVRGCVVELIALRSSLDRIRLSHTKDDTAL